MNTIKKTGRLTKSPSGSLPENSEKIQIPVDCTVLQFWEARDRRMLPFTNFMRLVLLYQIAADVTAEEMARKIGIDHKTLSAWLSFVSSDSVLEELLNEIGRALQHSSRSIGLLRLQKALKRQFLTSSSSSSRASIPKLRSDAKMPSADSFRSAVLSSAKTVLFQYALTLTLPKNKTVAIAAQEIADGLSWAYSYLPARDILAAWRKLLQSVQTLSAAKVEYQLLKVINTSVEGFNVDSSVKSRMRELEKLISIQTKDALRFAENYLHAIQQVAMDDDTWSEKSSAQYPVLAIPAEMSKLNPVSLSQIKEFINAMCNFHPQTEPVRSICATTDQRTLKVSPSIKIK